MLKFAKTTPYIPDPVRSRPHVTERDKELAATTPPHPVPFHCKPWLDGQAIGYTLAYGFLTGVTIRGVEDGKIEVDNLTQLARETNQPKVIDQFAPGHFGISSGYTLVTPPGMVSLLIPAVNAHPLLNPLPGVVESDWYPRQLFIVYKVPAVGQSIELEYGQPIARVVVVPRSDGAQAQALDSAELEALEAKRQQYLKEEATTPTAWTDANGQSFTNLYKQWSKREKQAD